MATDIKLSEKILSITLVGSPLINRFWKETLGAAS